MTDRHLADQPRQASSLLRFSISRLMVYLAFGALLGLVHQLTAHPMSAFLFFSYLVGLLVLTLYRQVARLPLLRRLLRPTRLTREGVYFLILTLVFGAAAINTGDNLLHLLLSVLLASILASGLLADLGLRRLGASRIPGGPYFEGVPGQMRLELTNRKRIAPSMSIVVEDQAEGLTGRAYFLSIPARRASVQTYRLVPRQRGPLPLSALRLSSRFPFGFFEKDRTIRAGQTLLVYPRVCPLRQDKLAGWGLEPESALAARSLAQDSGEQYRGLREYRPGDNPKRIHWRSTARRQTVLVREYLPPDGRQVVLLVDGNLPADESECARARLDICCRIAASLGYHYYLREFHVALQLPGQAALCCHRRQGTIRFEHLLERLASDELASMTLGEHLRSRPLPPGRIIPILPGPEEADAVCGAIPRRRLGRPIYAHQQDQLLDTDKALIPGQPGAITLQPLRDTG